MNLIRQCVATSVSAQQRAHVARPGRYSFMIASIVDLSDQALCFQLPLAKFFWMPFWAAVWQLMAHSCLCLYLGQRAEPTSCERNSGYEGVYTHKCRIPCIAYNIGRQCEILYLDREDEHHRGLRVSKTIAILNRTYFKRRVWSYIAPILTIFRSGLRATPVARHDPEPVCVFSAWIFLECLLRLVSRPEKAIPTFRFIEGPPGPSRTSSSCFS